MNWHFQTLVQAWAAEHSSKPIKELDSDRRLKNGPSCDFAIERSNDRLELIECKRFRPERAADTRSRDALFEKLSSRIPSAADQLNVTAVALGAAKCDTHLLVDITAYTDPVITSYSLAEATEVGGLDGSAVAAIRTELTTLGSGVDKITLCWHAPVTIAGRFRAIVQRATTVVDSKPEMLNYAGWTVEAYPLQRAEYRELRVSAVARSLAWILTTFRGLSSPETFVKMGPITRVE